MKSILNKISLVSFGSFLVVTVLLAGGALFVNKASALSCTNSYDNCNWIGCNASSFNSDTEICANYCDPSTSVQTCITSDFMCRDNTSQPCSLAYAGDVQGNCGSGEACVTSRFNILSPGFCQPSLGALHQCGIQSQCGCAVTSTGGTPPSSSCGDGICSDAELSTGSCPLDCGGAGLGVTISASPTDVVLPSNTTTLTWSTTGNPTSCTASGGWSGSVSTSGGTQTISNLSSTVANYTFGITCSNANGTEYSSVNVLVQPCAAGITSYPSAGSCSNVTSNGYTAGWTLASGSYTTEYFRASSNSDVTTSCNNNDANCVEKDTLGSSASSQTVPGLGMLHALSPNTAYYNRAVAYCTNPDGSSGEGISYKSYIWQCTTLSAPAAIGANLSASLTGVTAPPGPGATTLSFTATNTPDGCYLYRNGTYVYGVNTPAPGTKYSFNDTNLAVGTYNYQVNCSKAGQSSIVSNVVTVTSQAPCANSITVAHPDVVGTNQFNGTCSANTSKGYTVNWTLPGGTYQSELFRTSSVSDYAGMVTSCNNKDANCMERTDFIAPSTTSWTVSSGLTGVSLHALSPSTTYYNRAVAYCNTNPDGASGDNISYKSSVWSCSTSAAPPIAPTNFTATASTCGTGTINLSWTASTGATSYQVYRNGSLIYNNSSTSYSDTGLTAGTAYTYTITASNASGSSSAASTSPTSTTAPAVCGGPSTPTGFTATASTCGTGTINLSWTAATGDSTYKVCRDGTFSSGNCTGTLIYNNSGTSFPDTGLTAGSSHSYTIIALNSSGTASAVGTSTPSSVTAPATCGGSNPAIIAPVNGSTLSGSNQTFTWTPGYAGITNYYLYLSTTAVGSSDLIYYGPISYTGSNISQAVNGIIPTSGVTLYVRLWWQDGSACTSYCHADYTYTTGSGATTPTVTTTNPATSITSTTAVDGGTIVSNGGSTITVSGIVWSTTANPTTANSKTTDGWASGGPWTDTMSGLTASTTYHVRAYATNSIGTAYGADVQFTTSGAANPAITSPVNNSTLPGASVNFVWNAGTLSVTNYYLYLGTTVGSNNIDGLPESSSTLSQTVNNVPVDGKTLYVTLWWSTDGGTTWSTAPYTYTDASGGANPAITSPVNNSTLPGASVNFVWNAGTLSVTSYYLYVGTSTMYSANVGTYSSGNLDVLPESSSTLSQVVSNIPVDGNPLYVSLWWSTGGSYSQTMYTYTDASPGVMSGTLTGSNCTIALGASSCTTTLNWNVAHPATTNGTGVTSNTDNNGNSSANFSVVSPGVDIGSNSNVIIHGGVGGGSRTFYLYNSGTLLNSPGLTLTSSCSGSNVWNGTTCVAPTYTVTATAGANGTVTPPSQNVSSGSTATFAIVANSGYSPSVSDTCGGTGTKSGTFPNYTYTTAAVTLNCAVTVSFVGAPTIGITAGSNTCSPSNSCSSITLYSSSLPATLAWSGSGACTGTNFNSTGVTSLGTISSIPSSGSLMITPQLICLFNNPSCNVNSMSASDLTGTFPFTINCGGQPISVTLHLIGRPTGN